MDKPLPQRDDTYFILDKREEGFKIIKVTVVSVREHVRDPRGLRTDVIHHLRFKETDYEVEWEKIAPSQKYLRDLYKPE